MRNPNGYGSITKLSGKRRNPYVVRIACKYSTDGKTLKEHRPVLGYYHTRAEALKALSDYNKDPYDITAETTFGEIYDKWIVTKKISPGTLAGYRTAYEKCAELRGMPIKDIRLQHMQAVVDRWSHQSATQVRVIISIMRGVCGYAMRYDMIVKDWSQYLTSEHAEAKLVRKPYTEEEIDALWAAPPSELRDIALLMLYTGFRARELLLMPETGIDLTDYIYTGGSKTAAGKDRKVPMHHRIQPIAERYPHGFSVCYGVYYNWIKAAGHTPHDTRHTFVSRLQTAGADHVCIERLVGHASHGVTDKVYTHKDIDELRRAVELLR